MIFKGKSKDDFIAACAQFFIEQAIKERGNSIATIKVEQLPKTMPIHPIIVDNFDSIDANSRDIILESYNSTGAAYVIPRNADYIYSRNPIFHCVDSLRAALNLEFPIRHPLEGHPEAVERFGPNDGTFRVYDLEKPIGGATYREVAETSEPFEVHQDGLGSGGNVQTIFLHAASTPLFGGYTFVYDILAIAMAIRSISPKAFAALFQPDAITAIRPRGKGSIRVTSPILYIDQFGKPHSFFRKNSGEYGMAFRRDSDLDIAVDLLNKLTDPFADNSKFVSYTKGSLLIINNRIHAHGRTGFIDGCTPTTRRLLSRKWYMTAKEHEEYKHVPGTFAAPEYSQQFGGIFEDRLLWGEWNIDPKTGDNVRLEMPN